jgi:hypothetical protein
MFAPCPSTNVFTVCTRAEEHVIKEALHQGWREGRFANCVETGLAVLTCVCRVLPVSCGQGRHVHPPGLEVRVSHRRILAADANDHNTLRLELVLQLGEVGDRVPEQDCTEAHRRTAAL